MLLKICIYYLQIIIYQFQKKQYIPHLELSIVINYRLLLNNFAVCSNYQNFTAYITSFLLLAVFWIQHQRIFNDITRINEKFIWLNIFNMMFVVFIPFTTNLIEDYTHSIFAAVMFNSNLFIVGYINCLLYKCVYKYKLVEVGSVDMKPELHRFYVIPITSILAIIASFTFPSNGSLVYLLIPIYHRFRRVFYR